MGDPLYDLGAGGFAQARIFNLQAGGFEMVLRFLKAKLELAGVVSEWGHRFLQLQIMRIVLSPAGVSGQA